MRLIPATQGGEDIIITKDRKPVARLIPYTEVQTKRSLGLFRESNHPQQPAGAAARKNRR